MGWFFLFFVASGFCGLVYQVVWLRVAMADFGVTTPLVSIVLSVFMAGLAAGSWGGGRLARRLAGSSPATFLRIYAAAELVIGLSGVLVRPALAWGRSLLESGSGHASWGSGGYYAASALVVAAILLPFCTAMGATFPLAMAAMRGAFGDASERSFSYLYVANVTGALVGTLASAFVLIETLGFRRTLFVAASANAVVAVAAFAVSSRLVAVRAETRAKPVRTIAPPAARRDLLAFLFASGLLSLALEVVWTRQFVPFQGPMVYTFATILAVYLVATVAGSKIYRVWAARPPGRRGDPIMLGALGAGVAALAPLVAADGRIPLAIGLGAGALRVAAGVAPLCAILGFLTPMVVDRLSAGDPDRAGTAYAVNTLGCIVGPLLAGFALLPAMGERWTTVVLAVPFFAFAPFVARDRERGEGIAPANAPVRAVWPLAVSGAVALVLVIATRDSLPESATRIVMRDHTATVVASGEGMHKSLLVNGVGMTTLTPITKMMVHLPLAMLDRRPEKGLVLCMGMGTSFRSMLSWQIPTTVVELVPSVPSLFGFFHADGDRLRASPNAHIVIDDARRFLDRTSESFDVIVVDPPPPIDAAATSLLYSQEFYTSMRRCLKPGGIVQQWIPTAEPIVVAAAMRAITSRFPYVRAFRSIERWGVHILASDAPLNTRTPAELAARLPAPAALDIVEWGPQQTAERQFEAVVGHELSVEGAYELSPDTPALTDDHPVNEYFFVRELFAKPGNPAR